MRVSVALCTFNGAAHLDEQLGSFLQQVRLPDELVVADDGSSDGTLALVERFATKAPFAVTIVPPQDAPLGVTGNFERALTAATGDIVFPSDQDDVWLPAKIEQLLGRFSDPDVAMVCGNAALVDERGAALGPTLWSALEIDQSLRARVANGDGFRVLVERNFASGMALAVRRDIVARARPFPGEWYFDGWLGLWAAALGRVVMEEAVLVRYRQHGRNQIGARKRGRLAWLQRALTMQRGDFLAQARQLEVAHLRLRGTLADERLSDLAARMRHLTVRGTLPRARLGRLPTVARELRAGGYQAHAQGWVSAVVDLLAPG